MMKYEVCRKSNLEKIGLWFRKNESYSRFNQGRFVVHSMQCCSVVIGHVDSASEFSSESADASQWGSRHRCFF